MRTKIILSTTVLLLALGTVACATGGGTTSGIQISDAWARTVNMGAMDQGTSGGMGQSTPEAMGSSGSGEMAKQMGAVYMNIANTGAADKLLKAETNVAETVELHTVVDEGGVMQMRPVPSIDVPANGSVQLKPGGFHVMLIGVKEQLKPGDKINVKLTFEKAGTRDVTAEVRAQ